VYLDNIAAVREHYGSEIHLRNVKKRVGGDVSSLPPKPVQATTMASTARYYCSVCKKYFNSVATLQNHVQSKGHRAMKEANLVATPQEPRPAAENEDVELTATSCLFCPSTHTAIEENITHMHKSHGFYIPERTYCTDVDGLVAYLARKVNGCLCIVCGDRNREFLSLKAVRMHMVDSHHNAITLDEEYSDFYDAKVFAPPEEVAQVTIRDGRSLVRRGEVTHADPVCRSLMVAPKHQWQLKAHQEATEKRAIADKKQIRESRKDMAAAAKYWTTVGVQGNKLHPKGYDGEA
jgi:pre-60S factor REI1